jgi:hypothetical protein
MAENLAQQVESKHLEELKGPQEAIAYKMDFLKAVSQAKADLSSADYKLKSPEAKSFLKGSVGDINAVLARVAEQGRILSQKHAEGQKTEKNEFAPLDQIKGDLQAELSQLKSETGNFVQLEDANKQTEALAAEAEKKCFSISYSNPDAALAAAMDIQGRLPKNLPSTDATAAYRATVDTSINGLNTRLEDSIKVLPAFSADKKKIAGLTTSAAEYGKLATAYEKAPSDDLLAALRSYEAGMDPQKISEEMFKDKIGGAAAGIGAELYQQLWQNEFSSFRTVFEALKEKVANKEKEGINAEAKAADTAVDKMLSSVIKPAQEQYWAMNGEERHESEQEKNLLSKLLETKNLLAMYAAPEMKDKIDFATFDSIQKKFDDVSNGVRQIEKEKAQYLNDRAMGQKGLSRYVKFTSPQGYGIIEGQPNYEYTEEFNKLPDNEKIVIRMRVEEIDRKNAQFVKEQTAKAALEFMKPEEKLAALKEMLKEKGASYFSGIEKLKQKDMDGAIADFNAYIGQNFTPEEQALHNEQVKDAKDKIKEILGDRLQTVEALFADVKELRYARRKMGGNPELHYDEAVEADAINAELGAFKTDIAEGKVKDFNERFKQLQEKVREAVKKKDLKETGILEMLDKLNKVSQEKDPEKRKEGFNEFAKEARDTQAYQLAMKYLDYALEEDYKKAAKHLDKADVMKKMLEDPQFMGNLMEQAGRQYAAMIKEDPSLKESGLTPEIVKQKLMDRALNERYKKELRRMMTPGEGMPVDAALANYNNWFPIDDPAWYKPWDYGAEQWDEFQMDCIKFVWETLPTIGIGMAASAAGRVGARVAGKMVMKYLMRAGLTQAEAVLIEQGGPMALRAALKSGRALSYGATRLLGATAMEGLTMYGAGLAMEYMQTGHVSDFENSPGKIPEHMVDSMVKATAFRAVGLAQGGGPIAKAMQRGGAVGKAAWFASETVGGLGGMGMDALSAQLEGRDFTGKDAFKSMLTNYLTSVGMHAAHGMPRESAADVRVREAMSREDKMAIYESQFIPDASKIPPEMKGKPAFIDRNGQVQFAPDAFAEFGVGTTSREGKNLFVVDSLGGPYRGKKVELPAREFLRVLAKEREGKPLTPHEQALLPVARNVRDRMDMLKRHEVTHRVVEAANNASQGKLGSELENLFNTNPEMKKIFEERSSSTNRETAGFKSIQEFLSEVADGRITALTDAQKALIEKTVAAAGNIPGFRFDRIRNIDTKLLTNPDMLREHFRRQEAAASDAPTIEVRGQPDDYPVIEFTESAPLQVRSLRDLTVAIKDPSSSAMAKETVQALLKYASGQSKWEDISHYFSPDITKGPGTILAIKLRDLYKTDYENISRELSERKKNGTFAEFDAELRLNPLKREFLKYIMEEAKTSENLLNSSNRDGSPRTPEEIAANAKKLETMIREGKLMLGEANLETILSTAKGTSVLMDIIKSNTSFSASVRDKVINHYGRNLAVQLDGIIDATHLEKLINGKVNLDALQLINNDARNLLDPGLVEALIDGTIPAPRIEILSRNLNSPKMTPVLATKILTTEPITTTTVTGPKRFYDNIFSLGEGGLGKVSIAAIIMPDGHLTFEACKRSHGGGGQDAEVSTARRLLDAKSRGLRTDNIMEYHYLSDDAQYIFMEIYEYRKDNGDRVGGDLTEQTYNPDVPLEHRYAGIGGMGDALVALEEAGLINTDVKPDNLMLSRQPGGKVKGVMIDLGSVMNRETLLAADAAENTADSGGTTYHFYVPVGIGVTPGFWSTEIYTAVREGRLPPERVHTSQFGISLEAMVTGNVQYPRKTPTGYAYDDAQVVFPSGFPTPPYPADTNLRLLQLAKECKDPNVNITTREAVDRYRAIMKSINIDY